MPENWERSLPDVRDARRPCVCDTSRYRRAIIKRATIKETNNEESESTSWILDLVRNSGSSRIVHGLFLVANADSCFAQDNG